ncbi:hypothetical protein [Paraglaciecola arctica]|uniref:hypothetical protein n=1 Tax=Paraglaciecola arctica TaxID=1128911 RepID=UPI002091C7B8|nr:hypothetical protein [Paraglaciecola arctica]
MKTPINNTTSITTKAPKWFVVLAVVLVLWNLMGVMAFMMQISMTAEQIAALPPKQQSLYQDIPLWVNIAFGCAVFGGTLGCIALAFKKAIALPFLLISLVGTIMQMFHGFVLTKSYEQLAPQETILPVMIMIISLYLVWLTVHAKFKGWIT